MSRSYKKVAVYRDKKNKSYHKTIRRSINEFIKTNKYNLGDDDYTKQIPISKEIVNDYDYRDINWVLRETVNCTKDDLNKLKRK